MRIVKDQVLICRSRCGFYIHKCTHLEIIVCKTFTKYHRMHITDTKKIMLTKCVAYILDLYIV